MLRKYSNPVYNAAGIDGEFFEQNKVRIGRGKVKTVYEHAPYDLLTIEYSDDLSCFNKYRCLIEGKGEILNDINAWWMHNTSHIIPNHYLCHDGNNLLVKKCKRIDVEVVVRGYYTGSLTRDGNAAKYGLILPDWLKEGDKFENPIITPTTKDEEDRPLTEVEVVESGLATAEQWQYMRAKALELFEFGSIMARGKGLVLVDTKYEFGFLPPEEGGEIILIDEIHTPDSSRYWDMHLVKNYDKDHVRRFVAANPDAEIPAEVKDKVKEVYVELFQKLVGYSSGLTMSIYDYYISYVASLVVVIAGSKSDKEFIEKINKELITNKLVYHNYFHSAHKETYKVMSIIEQYNKRKAPTVFVTVAGCSNALGGVVAANVKKPVINCPHYKDNLDMYMNLNSSIMMPSGVPTSLVIRPDNLAVFVKRLFNL